MNVPRKNPPPTKATDEPTSQSLLWLLVEKNSDNSSLPEEFLTIGLLSCGWDFESILRVPYGQLQEEI